MNPCSLTILQAHTKLQNKELSALELVQSCIDRANKTDDKLHSFVHQNFDAALERAKAIDAAGNFDHPLAGIPYVTKDNYNETAVASTAASNVLREKDYVPPFTATTPDRLNNNGALSMGKVNTDEFTMGSSTETSCFTTTRNPWNTDCVAGGSSGGPAASVAADQCLFSIGTDTGGSIRQPAAFCGCTGIRLTYGRTSRYGAMSMASSFDTTGPLTKTVEDLAIVMNSICGEDRLDGTTSANVVPDFTAALTGDIAGLTIGLPEEYFIEGIDPEVEQAVRDAAALLEKKGATLKSVSLPHTKYGIACYYVLVPCEVSSNMARYDGIRYGHSSDKLQVVSDKSDDSGASELVDYYFRVRSEGFGDEVKRRIMIGTYALSAGYYDAYYRQAQKVRTLIKKDFEDVYKEVDVLLSPVTPTPAFKAGEHSSDPVAMYLEDAFTVSQALAGVPCLSVPCGFSSTGLPIGVQLMGPQWGEEIILRAADVYQRETDWHTRKPKIN